MDTGDGGHLLDLSIVIASYNTKEITRACLESIARRSDGLEYEVIVVDNGSLDGSAEMCAAEFPSVKLIRNSENRGFAVAQNVGLMRTQGKNLMILNSDVVIVGSAPRILINHLREHPELGIVGPQVLNPDGTVAPSGRRTSLSRLVIALGILNWHFNIKQFLPDRFLRKYLGFLLQRYHDNYARHDLARQVDFVDGMCLVVKREVLEEVGLLDEQFFFDMEIQDLSNRVRAKGWKIEFYPKAQVIHLAHSSRKRVPLIVAETHRSQLIYHAKYDPSKVRYICRVAMAVVTLKAFLLKAMFVFRRNDARIPEMLRICEKVRAVCSSFRADSVEGSGRIPTLCGHNGEERLRTDVATNSSVMNIGDGDG